MAAGAAGDYTLVTTLVQGYVESALPEQFSLRQSGALRVDTNPPFSADLQGGNTFTIRHLNHPTYGDQTPTANTDLTVYPFTSANEIGVVVRRADAYGIEDVARMAAGNTLDEWSQNAARYIAHQINYNAELRVFQKLIPGTISTSTSPLYATNCVDNSGNVFTYDMIADVNALMGENVNQLGICFMHPTVFWKSQVQTMLTAVPDYNAVAAYQGIGTQFVGKIGMLDVYLNSRCYTTGGVYDTVFAAPQSIYYGIQAENMIEVWRDQLKAGGTDLMKYLTAYSVHMPGVSFTGSAPTVGGGATDAAILTATNWTARTGWAITDTPVIVLKTTV